MRSKTAQNILDRTPRETKDKVSEYAENVVRRGESKTKSESYCN